MSPLTPGLSTAIGAAIFVLGAAQAPASGPLSAPSAPAGRISYVVAPAGPDGAPVEFTGPGAIVTARPDWSRRTKITPRRGQGIDMAAFSPDGTRLAWVEAGYDEDASTDGIYVADADGSGAEQVMRTSWTGDLAWSADGETLVLCEVTTGVYSVPADGSRKPKRIHDTPESGGIFGRFTAVPNGSGWIFEHGTFGAGQGDEQKTRELWRMNADGTGAGPLFTGADAPAFGGEPDLSPDGRTLVFTDRVDGRWSVVTAPMGSKTFTTLYTAPPGHWVDGPAWSPDGTRILVGTGHDRYDGPTRLLEIDPSTEASTTVRKRSSGAITGPSWATTRR